MSRIACEGEVSELVLMRRTLLKSQYGVLGEAIVFGIALELFG